LEEETSVLLKKFFIEQRKIIKDKDL
jgi:hypothetical protein